MIKIIALALLVLRVSSEKVDCDNVRYTFQEKEVGPDIPEDAFGGVVTVCGEGPCCTERMQKQLSYHAKNQFDSALNKTLGTLSSLLSTRASKFDSIFKDMMVKAKVDFDNMFRKTYGIIYEQNSYVFTDLFVELEKYYSKGNVDLIETMDNFFNILYQKMFTVLNAQYHFDKTYLDCVSDKMKEFKPFGDVPGKLSLQLKRSFVATRTFAQALAVAANIVDNVKKLSMSSSCIRAVAKMTHCPACSGLKELKPCSNYCTNVMKGCLAYHSMLDSSWNSFILEVDRLIERLLGPFNIEMVVEPINLKISDAIMNFQENAQQVSQRVFSSCGKPLLGRRRRNVETNKGEIPFETLKFAGKGKKNQNEGSMDSLERVIKDTRSKLKDTKNFWQKLPYHMCGTTVAEEQEGCWNGQRKDRYILPVIGDGMSNQRNNPEVNVDIHMPNSLVNEQTFALKAITSKLKNAYNGLDVEWIDTEDTFGSGGGSGYGTDDSDSDDTGSGMYPVIVDNNMPEPPRIGITKEGLDPEKELQPRHNIEDNVLYPIPDAGKAVYNRTSLHNSAPTMNRTIFSYLMPIVMVWIGSSVSEWFQT